MGKKFADIQLGKQVKAQNGWLESGNIWKARSIGKEQKNGKKKKKPHTKTRWL